MQDSTDSMTDDKLAEMRSDLDFKTSQMDHSISTSERLQRELSQRRVELEKIETLDEKIGVATPLTPVPCTRRRSWRLAAPGISRCTSRLLMRVRCAT